MPARAEHGRVQSTAVFPSLFLFSFRSGSGTAWMLAHPNKRRHSKRTSLGWMAGRRLLLWYSSCELPSKRQFGRSDVLLHAAGAEIHVPFLKSW